MGTQVHATCCSLGMPLFPDSQHGGTPLHFACMSGHALVCKMLLLRGASVNIRQRKVRDLACIALHCGEAQCTTMCQSVLRSSIALRSILLACSHPQHGATALHMGVHWDRVVASGVLIAAGADLTIKNKVSALEWNALTVTAARVRVRVRTSCSWIRQL